MITKMAAGCSPSKRKKLNINKTNKSTLQAKHQPWRPGALELDSGAEAGQEEGGT